MAMTVCMPVQQDAMIMDTLRLTGMMPMPGCVPLAWFAALSFVLFLPLSVPEHAAEVGQPHALSEAVCCTVSLLLCGVTLFVAAARV